MLWGASGPPAVRTATGRMVKPTLRILESREGAGRKVTGARGEKRARDSPAVARKRGTGPRGGPGRCQESSDRNKAGKGVGSQRVRVAQKRMRGSPEKARKRAAGPDRGYPGEERGDEGPQEAEESIESTLPADTGRVHPEAPERGPTTRRSPERGTVPAPRGRDATAHRQPPAARPPKDPG